MLKKTVTYTDLNGEEQSEDFYFHLSRAELVELELSAEGGLKESLMRLIATNDGKQIIAEFKRIILGAYGQKSPDGRRFIKSQELRDEFESTEAYSTLFMELVTDVSASVAFIQGIVPSGLVEEAAESAAKLKLVEGQKEEEIDPEMRIVTGAEVAEMNEDQLKQLYSEMHAGKARIVPS